MSEQKLAETTDCPELGITMEQPIYTETLDNGLTLLVEKMSDVQSAAFTLMVPAGCIFDPVGKCGTTAILCDLIIRGAGERTSRELSAELDNLGVQRSESLRTTHLIFSGAMIGSKLPDALRIYGDIVRRPKLPEAEFEPAISGVAQSLMALEDEPRQKLFLELRKRCYDAPWGRSPDGDLAELESISHADIVAQYERTVRPNGVILGVAGNVDPDEISKVVSETFGDWESKTDPTFETSPHADPREHIEHHSAQTHMAIAYDTVPFKHEEYYAAWAAVAVLSSGMSSRLFTEVREKRGLCYSVYATMNTLPNEARVFCYAGTTNERAQETLDVTVGELVRLGEGIGEDELERCKAIAKSSLVMAQESTSGRSSSIARDWFQLGRITTLDEVRKKIDDLTPAGVLDYVHRFPAKDFTIVTVGPKSLDLPA